MLTDGLWRLWAWSGRLSTGYRWWVAFLLSWLDLGPFIWFLTLRATSGIVAWLIALEAYRLLFWLTDHRIIPGLTSVSVVPRAVILVSVMVLVLVIPRTMVLVILVLVVPFRANTGVFRTRKLARSSSYIYKASSFLWSIKAFLDTLSYSNIFGPRIRNRDIGCFELLLEFPSGLRIEGHSGSRFILLR